MPHFQYRIYDATRHFNNFGQNTSTNTHRATRNDIRTANNTMKPVSSFDNSLATTSTNIFVYSINNIESCIEHYNDFGEGIIGVASRAGNVASAAFSQDEKRLLAVGSDGVVVIRNLKLGNNIPYLEEVIDKSNRNDYQEDDYGTHYGEFAGSYAQDVMGVSDDVINDAFEGDPDAYWNID